MCRVTGSGSDMVRRDALQRCFGERGSSGRSDQLQGETRTSGSCADRRHRSGPSGSRRSRLQTGRRSREFCNGDGCCARDCARSARSQYHRKARLVPSVSFSRSVSRRRTNFLNRSRRSDSVGRSVTRNSAAGLGQGRAAAKAVGICLLPLGSIRRHSRRSRP